MKKQLLSMALAFAMLTTAAMTVSCNSTTPDTSEPNTPSESGNQPTDDPTVNSYTITVENGTGSGTYDEGTSVTITAEEREDYVFDGWTVNGEVVSTESTYNYTVNADATLVATYKYNYSVWDVTVPAEAPETYVVDDEKKTVDINDAAALLYWKSLLVATSATSYCNEFRGYTYDNTKDVALDEEDENYEEGYTINLNCNVDLSAEVWDGIDAETPMLDGVVFNGNGHTIKGMNTVMKTASAGVRGWATGGFFTMFGSNQKVVIKDLTFKNSSVTGGGQIGIVVGGVYRCNLTLDNVDVVNSYLNGGTGHKIGTLIGRVGNCGDASGDHEVITIKNCDVKNVSIAGMRNMAGVVGVIFSSTSNINVDDTNYDKYMANDILKNLTFTNNTVSDCVFITYAPKAAEGANETTNSAFFYNYNVNMYDNALTVENDEVEGNTATKNTKINTYSYVNNDNGVKPLYYSSVDTFKALFDALYYETGAMDNYTSIYVSNDIDFTTYFAENPDYAEIVIPSTMTIYLVNGAKLVGIPEAVLAQVTVTDYVAE